MRTRLASLGLVVVTAALSAPYGHADDAPPAPPTPREGCATYTDAAGDAKVGNAAPTDPDLDITKVVMASPPGLLRAYITVDKLDTPQLAPGHQFLVSFLLESKPVTFYAGTDDEEAGAAREAAEAGTLASPLTGATYNGVTVKDSKTSAIYDTKTNTVILTTERAPIEAAAKGSLADGTLVKTLTVKSLADFIYTTVTADTATGTDAAKSEYTIGDNVCFAPPAGKLTLTAPASVVAGHTALVSGVLTTATGTAVAGKNVTVSLAGKTAQVTSGADGTFSTTFTVTTAGAYTATATWAGDDTLTTATASAPVTVKIQPTTTTLSSTVSGTTVTVKALVLDDLKKPVAGQTVTWLVDGKAAGSSKTDSTGRATLRTTRNHTVKGTFAGVRNRYASSYGTRRV